ncbi:MAG: hypothetical protein WC547_01300 [Candidatus Omnitrophota bacterium]
MSYLYVGFAIAAVLFCFLAPAASLAKDQRPKPQDDYVYDVGGKRDPFIPLLTADGRFLQLERSPEEEEESQLKVEGIIYDKYGLSYAIVDSSVVKVGDIIADYQVLKIEENKVAFIREGQIKDVFLQKED